MKCTLGSRSNCHTCCTESPPAHEGFFGCFTAGVTKLSWEDLRPDLLSGLGNSALSNDTFNINLHIVTTLTVPTLSCVYAPSSALGLTWTSEPGGGGGLGIGGWGTGRVVTEGLGWSSGWGCWRTWPWWARRHLMASVHSGPWWPPQPLSSYQSG